MPSGANPFSILRKAKGVAPPSSLKAPRTKRPSQLYNCPEHGKWRPPVAPSTDCASCWSFYGRWHHARRQSKGKAKGGGRSSKAKGRRGCEIVQQALLAAAPHLSDADIWIKATSQLGVDLHLSPLARVWFKYAIEVKFKESLNIWDALLQAEDNASPESPPIVFFRRAQSRLYVALHAEEFLKLLPCPEPNVPPPTPLL